MLIFKVVGFDNSSRVFHRGWFWKIQQEKYRTRDPKLGFGLLDEERGKMVVSHI
jgi:hypothetical protein